MHKVTDFHIHSRYSRACSKDLTLENIEKWCEYKGIDIIGTGDFTYPAWREDLNNKLEEVSEGLYALKNTLSKVRFILTTELALIYKQGDKCRRLHICIFAPNLNAINKISEKLDKIGNIKSDGRPILGLSARDLAELVLEVDEKCLVVPAHVWTPWFAVFGSKSGFDSIEECFGDMSPYIYAFETGLSASVPMNWMLSALDNKILLSNSDAHSPANLGREANVFDLSNPSYPEIYDIIKNHDTKKFAYSINFFPEEGKYHLDGHLKCKICFEPKETKKHKGICPKCKKPLTLGVLNRVYELADREYGIKPEGATPYKSIVPLQTIISESVGKGKNTKTVMKEYFNIIEKSKNEFDVLLNASEENLLSITSPRITEGILKVRKGDIVVAGGYDGVFGTVSVWPEGDRAIQKRLL